MHEREINYQIFTLAFDFGGGIIVVLLGNNNNAEQQTSVKDNRPQKTVKVAGVGGGRNSLVCYLLKKRGIATPQP